jgi:hypothetical protein
MRTFILCAALTLATLPANAGITCWVGGCNYPPQGNPYYSTSPGTYETQSNSAGGYDYYGPKGYLGWSELNDDGGYTFHQPGY